MSDTPFCDANYYSIPAGISGDCWYVMSNPDEFTILPAGGWKNGGDILYVDGMNFRGAQPFFDTAFDFLGILDQDDLKVVGLRAPWTRSAASGHHRSGAIVPSRGLEAVA